MAPTRLRPNAPRSARVADVRPSVHEVSGSDITVLVLTHQRLGQLTECLASLSVQTVSVAELIVVNNGSTDGTEEFLANSTGTTVITSTTNLGASGGRNLGIRTAKTEWIVLVDDDAVAEPDFVSTAVDAINVLQQTFPHVAIVAGCLVDDAHPLPDNLNVTPVAQFTAGCAAIRKSAFESAGCFPEDLAIYGEEKDLAFRLIDQGFEVVRAPNLRLDHHQRETDRKRHRRLRNMTTQDFRSVYQLTPVSILLPVVLWKLVFHLKKAVRFREFRLIGMAILSGNRQGIALVLAGQRAPVSLRTFIKIIRLRRPQDAVDRPVDSRYSGAKP